MMDEDHFGCIATLIKRRPSKTFMQLLPGDFITNGKNWFLYAMFSESCRVVITLRAGGSYNVTLQLMPNTVVLDSDTLFAKQLFRLTEIEKWRP